MSSPLTGHGTLLSSPLFLKSVLDRYPISASSLEKFYYVDGHLLERQYREHLGGYFGWEALPHADEWLVFPENVGPNMCEFNIKLYNLSTVLVVRNCKTIR